MGLTETQQVVNLLQVVGINNCLVNQVTLLFLGFLCQDVTVKRMMSLNLTSTGQTKSLLCTGVCLYFWHFLLLFDCYLFCGNAYTGRYAHVLVIVAVYSSPFSFFRASALILALANRPPLAGSAVGSCTVALGASAFSLSLFSLSMACWLFFTAPVFFGAM